MKQLTEDRIENERYKGTKIITSYFGKETRLGKHNYLEQVEMDDYSYSGEFCFFQNVRIGKMCSIAAMVRIGATDHPMERILQHTLTYRSERYGFAENDTAFFQRRLARKTIIGHDVWIGHGAIIKPGITVGNGAVIGSGTIVTKDVPPFAIVAKTPMEIIRYRFTPEQIERIEAIQPWNFTPEQLKKWMPIIRMDATAFIEKWEEEMQ